MTMRNLLKIFEAEPATAPPGQAAMSYAGNQAGANSTPEPETSTPPSSGVEQAKIGIAAGSPAITGAAPASNMKNAADVMRGGQATKPEPAAAPAAAPAATPAPQTNALGIAPQANISGSPTATAEPKTEPTPAPQTNALGIAPQANISGSPTAPAAQAAKPSEPASTAVKGGFGQSTNISTRTPDQIAADNKKPFGAQQNQATKSYASIGDFASAIGNKIKGAIAPTAGAATASPGAAQAMASKSAAPAAKPGEFKSTGMQSTDFEESIEEELAEMMRLSGLPLNEKAVSKQQQKFMGMVHAMQKGEKVKGAGPELKKAAKGMTKKAAHDFAATKHKGLPQKVSESVMLEAGSTLEHIIKKFKHETKNFLAGNDLDNDLYDALYDYYSDNGEMPYGVAKARDGDPYQWISNKFADEMQMHGYGRQADMLNMPGSDHELTELARLAGLSESQVTECGDMDMGHEDSMNVSTNMSSDGTKNVSISAQGDKADVLLQMLKMAGMRPHDDHDEGHEEVVVIGAPDEMMDEEYANSPDEEYETVSAITRQGNDLNREKRQYSDKPKLGDNPMAEDVMLDEELQDLLDSVLFREEMTDVLKAEQPYRDEKTGKMVTPPKGATNPPPDSAPAPKTNAPKVK